MCELQRHLRACSAVPLLFIVTAAESNLCPADSRTWVGISWGSWSALCLGRTEGRRPPEGPGGVAALVTQRQVRGPPGEAQRLPQAPAAQRIPVSASLGMPVGDTTNVLVALANDLWEASQPSPPQARSEEARLRAQRLGPRAGKRPGKRQVSSQLKNNKFLPSPLPLLYQYLL